MTGRPPSWSLAVVAMLSVQLGAALSLGLMEVVGPGGTAWLRLTIAAVVFLVVARPPLRSIRRSDLPVLVGLGVTTGLQTVAFLAAIERLPLGTVVAIEFLGPLTVAAVRSHRAAALVWPALALVGVVLLTEPWHGQVSVSGLVLSGLAAAGWGGYILLTQAVGDRFDGIKGLALTVPIAAVTAAVIGVPQAVGNIDARVLVTAAGLALLLPIVPYALEMFALRRMTHTAFGTLMALEPAFGVVIGAVVLQQWPMWVQVVGIIVVVVAGAGAQRGGVRSVAEPQIT